MTTQQLEQCPLDECHIREEHGHGTERRYLGKSGPKPGSLETLLRQAFEAGREHERWLHFDPEFQEPQPPGFDEWRRAMLPDEEDSHA